MSQRHLGLGENQSQAYQLIKDDDSFFFVGMSGSVAETLYPRPASNVETGSPTLLHEIHCTYSTPKALFRSQRWLGFTLAGRADLVPGLVPGPTVELSVLDVLSGFSGQNKK